MTRAEVLRFLREHKHAVEATVHPDGAPQAAVVGVAVTDTLELVFDTLTSTRKHGNLARDGRCALTVWHDAITVQLEGRAELLTGDVLAPYQATYLSAFPDGHDRKTLPDIAYWRVRPHWIRTSDFTTTPPAISVHELAWT